MVVVFELRQFLETLRIPFNNKLQINGKVICIKFVKNIYLGVGKEKEWSKHPVINAGYFQGLQEEVHRRTGITRPVIYKAIRDNDTGSAKRLLAVRTALQIIEEREHSLEMVQEPSPEYSALDPSGNYTYWDYIKWQFRERVELIRGKVVKMSPAPNVAHQRVSSNINRLLDAFFFKKPCSVFYAPFDVRLPVKGSARDSTVVQPDLCIICDESRLDRRGCNGAPDLIVEILSPGNNSHDMQVKFELYEQAAVPEYWIVDPAGRTLLIYSLLKGRYVGLRPFTEGMQAESVQFPGLIIDLDALFSKVI